MLSAYLPQQAGADEVAAEIDAAVAQVAAGRAPTPADMGKVMALVKAKLAGRTDLSAVSGLVKARLAGGKSCAKAQRLRLPDPSGSRPTEPTAASLFACRRPASKRVQKWSCRGAKLERSLTRPALSA